MANKTGRCNLLWPVAVWKKRGATNNLSLFGRAARLLVYVLCAAIKQKCGEARAFYCQYTARHHDQWKAGSDWTSVPRTPPRWQRRPSLRSVSPACKCHIPRKVLISILNHEHATLWAFNCGTESLKRYIGSSCVGLRDCARLWNAVVGKIWPAVFHGIYLHTVVFLELIFFPQKNILP